MADGTIQLSPDSTGKKVDTEELTVGLNTVHRERMQIAGDSATDIAPVTAADGLTVNLGTNNDVTVASLPLPSGAATLAEQQTQSTALAAIETAVELLDNAVSGTELQVDVVAALPAGTNNIGDVDIVSLPNEGQQTMANSISVAVASDQSAVPVSGTVAVTGVSTLAEQQAQTALLTTIDADTGGILTAVQLIDNAISGSEMQVDVVTSALPTGASTLAEQQAQTTLLGTIDADTGGILTAVQLIDNAISGSEMQVDVVAALPAGNNNIGDVDVASVIPGTGATNLGKAVDSIPGATDTGVVALGVRDDALSTLTPADGDYTQLRVDSTGALWTRSTSAAGGTSATDEDAYVAGTSTGTPVMGAFDDASPDVLAEDTLGIIRATTARGLHVNLRDASGNEVAVGGGTQYTEDAAAAANPVGTALNLIRQDALSGLVTNDGDNVAARGTNNGELYVKHVDAIPVTDNGGALTVDGTVAVTGVSTLAEQQTQTAHLAAIETAVEILDNAIAGSEMQVDVVSSALPTGASTLAEQQTQTTHLATIAGDTTDIETAVELIDDTVAVLGTTTYTEAATKGLIVGAIRRDADTTLVDTTNEVAPLQVDANGRLKVEAFSGETLPVSGTVTANLAAGTNNIGDVDVLSLPAIPAGNNNIGDVDIASAPTGSSSISVQGTAAHAAAAVGNPVYIGGRASTAVPTDVGADADVAAIWVNRNGLVLVSGIPGAGLNADPYTLLSETAQYTTTQTSTVLVAGGASERIVITSIQIQAGGTTAGTCQVYFGTGAYSRGTDEAIFDGEFAPSATLKPGFYAAPPSGFRAGALGDDVLVTTSAAINPLTITIWYYVLGV